VNSQVPSKFFCGEGPQLAWGEESAKRSGRFAPSPQGENVLDASMMAELIVTKKEIVSQPKQARRNRAHRAERPGVVVNRCSRWKDLETSTSGLVPCMGAFVVPVFAASIGTPVEGKIGTFTAEWTPENQGHPYDRQKPERCQRSGRAGLDRALVAAEGDLGCRAATRLHEGAVSPMAGALRGIPAEWGRERQRLYRWLDGGRDFSPPWSFAVAFNGKRKAETRSVECHFVAS
jgi:hypothetical protein